MQEKHRPMVTDEYAKKLRNWQNNVYIQSKNRKTSEIEFLGRKFIIPPKVHTINPMSDLLGNSVLEEVRVGDRVLDMGTGCGVNAILAASKSDEVIGVDINPEAIQSARMNAELNEVDSKISFLVSDVFDQVHGRFDLIVFDPPFRWFKPRDIHEVSTTDENYQSLKKFFSGVHKYLTRNGRILLCFGSSGDIAFLNQLIGESGFQKEIIAERILKKDEIEVVYYTYRLKR